MKHTLVVESHVIGKFTWELPDSLAKSLFESDTAIEELPNQEMQRVAQDGIKYLTEDIEETVAVQLAMIVHSVHIGLNCMKPVELICKLQTSRSTHLALMGINSWLKLSWFDP